MNPQLKHYSRYFTYIEPVLRAPIIRTYGSLIMTIVALIVFIVFAIKPTIATISTLQKTLEVKKETLAKLTKKNQDLTQAGINLNNIPQETKDKLQSLVPNDTAVSQLVKSLESTTSKSQASLSALQFQPLTIEPKTKSTKDSTLVEIPFVYNVENKYEVLNTILTNFRANPRLVSVDSFTINKIEDSQNLLLSITGRAYYIK